MDTENIFKSLILHFKFSENSLKLKDNQAKVLPVLRYLGYQIHSGKLEVKIPNHVVWVHTNIIQKHQISYFTFYIFEVSLKLQDHLKAE